MPLLTALITLAAAPARADDGPAHAEETAPAPLPSPVSTPVSPSTKASTQYWVGAGVATTGGVVAAYAATAGVMALAFPGCHSVQGLHVSRTECSPQQLEKSPSTATLVGAGVAGLALLTAGVIVMLESKPQAVGAPATTRGLGSDGVVRF